MNFTDDDNGINNDMSRWMDKRVYQLEMKSGAAQRNCALAQFLCYKLIFSFQNFPIGLANF